MRTLTPAEEVRARALLRAIREAEDGPGLSRRVSDILRRSRPDAGEKRVRIDPERLGDLVYRLGGTTEAARRLGVAYTTITHWAITGRIPRWAIERIRSILEEPVHGRRGLYHGWTPIERGDLQEMIDKLDRGRFDVEASEHRPHDATAVEETWAHPRVGPRKGPGVDRGGGQIKATTTNPKKRGQR